jgi:hypothetical protein
LATTAAVYALNFGPTGVRRALKGDMDSIADIIVHLAQLSLPNLRTNTGLKNRHRLREIFSNSRKFWGRLCGLPDQHRKLENENRSSRSGDRKKRLREPDGEDFVCHVPSPLIELIER